MDGADAALSDSAAILGAGETELLSQDSEKRCVLFGFELNLVSIDNQRGHAASLRRICFDYTANEKKLQGQSRK